MSGGQVEDSILQEVFCFWHQLEAAASVPATQIHYPFSFVYISLN
jgi:hypothetical protein